MKDKLFYRNRYKYQVVEPYTRQTKCYPPAGASIPDYISLTPDGVIRIEKGYAWDGPSGPTFDTKNFMPASLVHDALYQLIREGHLPPEDRLSADQTMLEICLEDGMSVVRARYCYSAVRMFGGPAASGGPRQVLEAP